MPNEMQLLLKNIHYSPKHHENESVLEEMQHHLNYRNCLNVLLALIYHIIMVATSSSVLYFEKR